MGQVTKSGTDFLAYSLMDAIVDSYFGVLETVGEKIEDLEEEVVNNPVPETLHSIHRLKREMICLRKIFWPSREIISVLIRDDSKLFARNTTYYLRDIYDHIIQVIDTTESFRDIVAGILDIYLSSISNRMNEVMKVLTIIATIFIPLTTITGIYGMNFKFMPELNWHYGYFLVLGLMVFIGLAMLSFFRKKKWI